MEDTSKNNVIRRLIKNGYSPISITQIKSANKKKKKKKKNKIDSSSIAKTIGNQKKRSNSKNNLEYKKNFITKKITTRDIIVFTQNFYLLKKANFNNIHALATISQSIENEELREIVEDILAGVEAGDTMYSTMEYYSDVFSPIYINMIKVGELSGSLTNSLEQAVNYLEQTSKFKKTIRDILVPNLIQFFGILILLIVGTVIAVPFIQQLFADMGSTEQLPAITIAFSNFIDKIMEIWYIPTMAILAIVTFILYYINTPKGKYNFHMFKYTVPVFGRLVFSLDMQKFLKALHLNILNGMRIQEAIDISKNVIKNYVMLSIIETSKNNLIIGESWIKPFEDSNLCPAITTEMLKIGMQTDLSEMMYKILDFMDSDIKNALDKVVKVLPQIVTALVGVVLIFFVLVVLVPLIQVYMGGWLLDAYI